MENFSFKNLTVWSKSLDFAEKCFDITESMNGHFRVREQLEGGSASIPQNISEGHGRVSNKENIQYLYISRGSLYEAITVLNLLFRKKIITKEVLDELESLGMEITKMINKLASSKRNFN